MSKSYRIRTEVGVDKQINVQLEQDFEQIEILSLKVRSEDVYTRMCADYGVVVGRVFTNGGYGVPNVKVSIFIPISDEDLDNEIISELYPYREINDLNADGYRYNLLPYEKTHGGHTPTGTFPSKRDILTNPALVEVYDKYYKFTVKTNGSGDYMIMGVPTGTHTLVMDVDLSDIGPFSLGPQDLVRMGRSTSDELRGATFPSSTDLESLPQIVNLVKSIEVEPFWGQPEVCQIGIVRHDFNLGEVGVTIQPTALFMGSLISNNNDKAVSLGCRPPTEMGDLCNLTTNSGEIIGVRQTIFQDDDGLPILESAELPQGGKVIDEDGTWLLEVPMNLDFVTTNEFGEQILSNDPSVGVPTKGKYRFKIKYGQPNSIELNSTRRGYFLVPNVKEYGWTQSQIDPIYSISTSTLSYEKLKSSYYFGLDWSGYTNGFTAQAELENRREEIVNCEDTFYEFVYNKVYTVSGLIDQYYKGLSRGNFIGIKEITDSTCASENNKFPATDAVRNFDFTFFIVNLFLIIFAPIGRVLIPILNFLAQFWPIAKWVIVYLLTAWLGYNTGIYAINAILAFTPPFPAIALGIGLGIQSLIWGTATVLSLVKVAPLIVRFNFTGLKLPMISYPDCDACDCSDEDLVLPEITGNPFTGNNATTNQVGDFTLYNVSGVSPLFPSYSQSTWGVLVGDPNDVEPVGINPDDYSGNSNKRTQKYTADITGFRYGMSGMNYVLPPQNLNDENINKLANTPITISYTRNKVPVGPDITLSQSLNLMNIRERYFENLNIVQTTVSNTSTTSQPFTDNVLVLLVPQNNWSNGEILTFNDTESINDLNFTGNTPNQFGTTSITGSTSVGVVSKTVTYIHPNGLVGSSTVYINSTQQTKNYQYPTGVEYCQVITQYSTTFVDSNLNVGSGSLLEKYLFDKEQKLDYIDSLGVNKSVTLNSLKSIGESWKDYYVVFLVRGVDVYTEPQVIKYDLNKLFGYSFGTQQNLIVQGPYRLNVPIQPNSGSGAWFTNFKTPESHLTNYLISPVFHQPYNFVVSQNEFQPVLTDKLSYYSSLDKSTLNFATFVGDQPISYFVNNSYLSGGSVSDDGDNNQIIRFFGNQYQGVIEGGTFIAGSQSFLTLSIVPDVRVFSPAYFQPGVTQPPTAVHTIIYDNTVNNAKLVLRSDRLPTSDLTIGISPVSNSRMVMFQNPRFSMFVIESSGQSSITINTGSGLGFFEPTIGYGLDNNLDRVISSFGCSGMVPLKCYSTDANGQLTVLDPCPDNENPVRVSDGCYDFVKPDKNGSYLKNIPILVLNYLEWIQRFRVMFGACRGVFSHVFVNSWVNGSLFAYPFRNKAEFNLSGDLVTRKVVINPITFVTEVDYSFCADLLYFDNETNNFYYRSSPYDNNTGNFIGKKASTTVGTPLGIYRGPTQDILNSYNLQYPTTVLDLGPKYFWTKDVIPKPDYYGYTADKIPTSSWNEISNLFQTFVISRLINTNFWNLVYSTGNASISNFFSRKKERIDGDYAQMLQTNSQFGVKPLNEGNYVDDPAIPGDNPIFISKDLQGDPIFGIFYDSYPTDRDIISPRRIDRTTTGFNLIADYLGTKSQVVPFYLWKNNAYNASFSQIIGGCVCEEYTIDNTTNSISDTVGYQDCNTGQLQTITVAANQTTTVCGCQGSVTSNIAIISLLGPCTPPPSPGAENSIFGNQFNSWYTVPTEPIFSTKLQSLDRLGSPYFIGNNGQIQNRVGYIFQRNSQGEYVPQNLGGYNMATLTSGPWYFYFGLKQGGSAIDKFRQIYIGTDE
jgi:hypothetical protein